MKNEHHRGRGVCAGGEAKHRNCASKEKMASKGENEMANGRKSKKMKRKTKAKARRKIIEIK